MIHKKGGRIRTYGRPAAPDLRRTKLLMTKEGPAYNLIEREFHDHDQQQLVGSRGIQAPSAVERISAKRLPVHQSRKALNGELLGSSTF